MPRPTEHTRTLKPKHPDFHASLFCFKKRLVLTFPKLPFPMARRIWKWSKLTVKKEKVDVREGLLLGHGVHVLPTSLLASVHPPYRMSAPGH